MTEGVLTYLEQARHIRQVGYRDQIPVDLPRESGVRFARPPDDGRALVAVLLRTGFTASPEGPAPAPYRLTETLLRLTGRSSSSTRASAGPAGRGSGGVNPRERDTDKAIDCSPETS